MKCENIFTLNHKQLKNKAKDLMENIKKIDRNSDIILGADLSSKSTGICVLNSNKDILFMDKIYIPGYSTTPEEIRILSFVICVNAIIKTFNPKYCVIEDIFSDNVRTHKNLAKIHGIFIEILIKNNIEPYYIHPQSAKSFIKCKTKEDVFNELTEMYNLNLSFEEANDGVDALLMALNFDNDKKVNIIGGKDVGSKKSKSKLCDENKQRTKRKQK